MSEATDAELLRRYAHEKSEQAFAELVRRRINVVYAVARRQVGGDAQLAEDVTQRVFVDLARKAASLADRAVLTGWLCRSAQFAATDVVRAERRRRRREEVTQLMHEPANGADESLDWENARPVLDRVLSELNDEDRDAVALRFFEGRPFAEIGATLRLTEEAARKRVDRALDKLHAGLARRGVTSTTAALVVALAQQTAAAVPTGLTISVTGAALAGVGASSATVTAALFMGMTKIQLAVVSSVLAAGTMGFVAQERTRAATVDELARIRAETTALAHAKNLAVTPRKNETQPSGQLAADQAELTRLKAEAAELKRRTEAGAKAAERFVRLKSRSGGKVEGEVFDPKQVDVPPTPTTRVPPQYPPGFTKAGKEGRALVSFVVDKDGRVFDVRAEQATEPEFAEAAMDAIEQWKFSPGQKAGVRVNTRIQQMIMFTIAKDQPAKLPRIPSSNWF